MLLTKEEQIKEFNLAFSHIQHYIRPLGPLHLTDINIHMEDFVADLLNRLYGWKLVNKNKLHKNYPCIDLLDQVNRIGIQVSTERGVKKINETINCLVKNKMDQEIAQLKIFSLLPKQGSYAVRATCPGIAFNWRNDVLDFDHILLEIDNVVDDAHLLSAHSWIKTAVPSVFRSSEARREACCQDLRRNLLVFDRQVMSAAEKYEDPVLMCRAIREMRITLQKSGASTIANTIAAMNFKYARNILAEKEYEVRDKWSYIFEAACHLPDGQNIPWSAYNGGDYGDSIRSMMEIRLPLDRLLDEIKTELKRLEQQP